MVYAPFVAAALLMMAAVPAFAAGGADAIATAVGRQLSEKGPLILPEEQAYLDRACGTTTSGREGQFRNLDNDTMICRNGKVVRDPEVGRIGRAISKRADVLVEEVMASPDVRRAMDGTVAREVRAALEKARASLARTRTDRAAAERQSR
jgi:hypothetical protein